jgi:ATP-binding cassette subfamily F protein 3
MRLAFATLFMKHYDVLLLDEPTNHLDLTTKKVLENALDEYQGTVIMVSHDRYFVDEVAKEVWYIANRELVIHEGNYSSYQLSLQPLTNTPPVKVNSVKDKTVEKRVKTDLPSLVNLEKQLADLMERHNHLHELLSHPDEEMDYVQIRELEDELSHVDQEIQSLEYQYLERLAFDEQQKK